MKLATAMQIIDQSHPESPKGFRVHFDRIEGSLRHGDFFPERDEEPFDNQEATWQMAQMFARTAPKQYVNIYVIHALDFTPVAGGQILRQYPQPIPPRKP